MEVEMAGETSETHYDRYLQLHNTLLEEKNPEWESLAELPTFVPWKQKRPNIILT
jgi:hypothetical protein